MGGWWRSEKLAIKWNHNKCPIAALCVCVCSKWESTVLFWINEKHRIKINIEWLLTWPRMKICVHLSNFSHIFVVFLFNFTFSFVFLWSLLLAYSSILFYFILFYSFFSLIEVSRRWFNTFVGRITISYFSLKRK